MSKGELGGVCTAVCTLQCGGVVPACCTLPKLSVDWMSPQTPYPSLSRV